MGWWRRAVRRESTAEEFWAWFAGEAATFHAADLGERSDLVGAFGERLRMVDDRLAFQISALRDGVRDVEISADGLRALAPKVHEVVGAAPRIAGWRIHAFRQPVENEVSIRFGEMELDWQSIRFVARRSPATLAPMLDVELFVGGLTRESEDRLMGAVFLLLDALLGEEAVMTRLNEIAPRPLTQAPGGHRPLVELRDEVRALG